MLIVCVEPDLGELDRLMSQITDSSIARMRWLVVSVDIDRLTTLSTLWRSSTEIVPCHVPRWGPEIEGGVESILGMENDLDSPSIVLKAMDAPLSGELLKLRSIDFSPHGAPGSYFSDTAKLLEKLLNEPFP